MPSVSVIRLPHDRHAFASVKISSMFPSSAAHDGQRSLSAGKFGLPDSDFKEKDVAIDPKLVHHELIGGRFEVEPSGCTARSRLKPELRTSSRRRTEGSIQLRTKTSSRWSPTARRIAHP